MKYLKCLINIFATTNYTSRHRQICFCVIFPTKSKQVKVKYPFPNTFLYGSKLVNITIFYPKHRTKQNIILEIVSRFNVASIILAFTNPCRQGCFTYNLTNVNYRAFQNIEWMFSIFQYLTCNFKIYGTWANFRISSTWFTIYINTKHTKDVSISTHVFLFWLVWNTLTQATP